MDTPKTIEELDEMRARAMFDSDRKSFKKPHVEWATVPKSTRLEYIRMCRAIREADERAGLVTVPVELTEDMQAAALLVPIKGDHGWVCKIVAPGSKCYADYPLCDNECTGETINTLRDESPVDVYAAMLAASPFAKKEA